MKSYFKLLWKIFPLLFILVLLSGCAAVPVSDQELSAIGADVHRNMVDQYGEYDNLKITEYVKNVGKRVEASSDYSGEQITFTVLDTPVVNAFAVPGGYVHVTRGLLARANSEAELSFVLGHEIGHLTAKHSAQRISQMRTSSLFSSLIGIFVSIYTDNYDLGSLAAGIVDFSSAVAILSYGRDAEFEADSLGIKYSYDSDYDVKNGSSFLKTLGSMEDSEEEKGFLSDLLATHPPTRDRIEKSEGQVNDYLKKEPEKKLDVNRNEYLKIIDGIVLGDSLESGFVKDGKYFNKKYLFTLSRPKDWKIITSHSYRAGLYHDRDNMFLVYANSADNNTLKEYATSFLKEVFEDENLMPKFTSTTFSGFSALNYHGSKGREIQATFFRSKSTDYVLVYSYNFQMFVDYNLIFSELKGNFTFMDEETAAGISESKLKIYTVKSGDTYESLSSVFFNDQKYSEKIKSFNGIEGVLSPGVLLKIPDIEYFKN